MVFGEFFDSKGVTADFEVLIDFIDFRDIDDVLLFLLDKSPSFNDSILFDVFELILEVLFFFFVIPLDPSSLDVLLFLSVFLFLL